MILHLTKKLILILFFTLVTGIATSCPLPNVELQSDDKGLLMISSCYTDELTKKIVPTFGVATPIQWGQRQFLLTNSHLSQGSSGLKVFINGRPVNLDKNNIISRVLNSGISDLELIEVKIDGFRPLFTYNSKQSFVATEEFSNWLSATPNRDLFDQANVDSPDIIKVSFSDQLALLLPYWKKNQVKAWKPTISPFKLSFNDSLNNQLASAKTVTEGKEILLPIKISGGVSGSPLISFTTPNLKANKSHYQIECIAKKYSIFYNRSYCTGKTEIVKLFKNIKATQIVNLNSKVKWHYYNGYTYRDYGNGTKELNPLRLNSGGGGMADGTGNAGGGGMADGTQSFLKASNDPWKSLKTSPGILYRGQEAIGLEVKKSGLTYFLNADELSLEKLKIFANVKPIKQYQLIPTLFRKLKTQNKQLSLRSDTASNIQSSMNINRNQVKFVINIGTDTLEFLVSSKGEILNNNNQVMFKNFRPLFIYKGTDDNYLVDLTYVFFNHHQVFEPLKVDQTTIWDFTGQTTVIKVMPLKMQIEHTVRLF